MSAFVDIEFLVSRQSELHYLAGTGRGGYASGLYASERTAEARHHWTSELFKQRKKPSVLGRLQQLEAFLRDHLDAWWDYGYRKKLEVWGETGLLTTI